MPGVSSSISPIYCIYHMLPFVLLIAWPTISYLFFFTFFLCFFAVIIVAPPLCAGRIASSYYSLQIYLFPLAYLSLFNRFAFTQPIYQLMFILAGFVTVGCAFAIYGFNRLLTRVRHPVYHGWPLWVAVVQPCLIGCTLGNTTSVSSRNTHLFIYIAVPCSTLTQTLHCGSFNTRITLNVPTPRHLSPHARCFINLVLVRWRKSHFCRRDSRDYMVPHARSHSFSDVFGGHTRLAKYFNSGSIKKWSKRNSVDCNLLVLFACIHYVGYLWLDSGRCQDWCSATSGTRKGNNNTSSFNILLVLLILSYL